MENSEPSSETKAAKPPLALPAVPEMSVPEPTEPPQPTEATPVALEASGPATDAPALSPHDQAVQDFLAKFGPMPAQQPDENPQAFADRMNKWRTAKSNFQSARKCGPLRLPKSPAATATEKKDNANEPAPAAPAPKTAPIFPSERSISTGGGTPSLKRMRSVKRNMGLDDPQHLNVPSMQQGYRKQGGDLIGVVGDIYELEGRFSSKLILLLSEEESVSGNISGKTGYLAARGDITFLPNDVTPFAGNSSQILDTVEILHFMGNVKEIHALYAGAYDLLAHAQQALESEQRYSDVVEKLYMAAKAEFVRVADLVAPHQAFLDNVTLIGKYANDSGAEISPGERAERKNKESNWHARCLKMLQDFEQEYGTREGLIAGDIVVDRNVDGSFRRIRTLQPDLDWRSADEKAWELKPFVPPTSVSPTKEQALEREIALDVWLYWEKGTVKKTYVWKGEYFFAVPKYRYPGKDGEIIALISPLTPELQQVKSSDRYDEKGLAELRKMSDAKLGALVRSWLPAEPESEEMLKRELAANIKPLPPQPKSLIATLETKPAPAPAPKAAVAAAVLPEPITRVEGSPETEAFAPTEVASAAVIEVEAEAKDPEGATEFTAEPAAESPRIGRALWDFLKPPTFTEIKEEFRRKKPEAPKK